jgi:cytochrome c biogenesis protein CcmG, thiol:disulfide interchange protein DsbE
VTATASQNQPNAARRRLLVLIPLIGFAGLAAVFYKGLGVVDPSQIPSALIGHPAPQTALPPVAGLTRDGAPVPGIDPAAFNGQVSLINVWASWCVPCHEEAPLLMRLAQDKRIRLIGINYKDQPENARRFLGRYGDPFVANGADENGRAAIEWGVYGVPESFVVGRDAIEWGVYGVPESFVVGRDARIAFKLIGPITPDNFAAVLTPEIEKAIGAGG